MLGAGVLLLAVDEHLDLVELVDADDTHRVLTGGTRLTTVAAGPTAVAQRAVVKVENLVLMHAGERNLGRADQILVIRLAQTVDLVRMGVEESGSGHDFGAHQRRGDGEREAVFLSLVDSHGEHGDLQAGDRATQEVEAGAGDLDATLHIDAGNAFTELKMVLRFETFRGEITDGADLLDDHVVVFAAFRGFRLDDVAELPHRGRIVGSRLVSGVLVFGDLVGQLLGLGDDLRLVFRGGGGDLFAHVLLFGTRGFEGLKRLATGLVRAEHLVHEFHGFPALALGFLDDVRVFTDELNIKHSSRLMRQADT